MPVMSRRVGVSTDAWTRMRATLSATAMAAFLAACSTQLGGAPPHGQKPGEAANAMLLSAKARYVSLDPAAVRSR